MRAALLAAVELSGKLDSLILSPRRRKRSISAVQRRESRRVYRARRGAARKGPMESR